MGSRPVVRLPAERRRTDRHDRLPRWWAFVGTREIVSPAAAEMEVDLVAKDPDAHVDPGTHSTARAADCLVLIDFYEPPVSSPALSFSSGDHC